MVLVQVSYYWACKIKYKQPYSTVYLKIIKTLHMAETSESLEAIFIAAIKQVEEIQIDLISAWISDLFVKFGGIYFVGGK
jgi:hypothetical protein